MCSAGNVEGRGKLEGGGQGSQPHTCKLACGLLTAVQDVLRQNSPMSNALGMQICKGCQTWLHHLLNCLALCHFATFICYVLF